MTCSAFSVPLPTLRRAHSIPMFFLLLIAACGLATADVPKAKPSPCALTDAEAAGLNGDASTDVHAVSNYSKTVYGLLQAGKFSKLDCLADSARSRKETFPGGTWKIHAIYNGLAKPPLHATQEDWNNVPINIHGGCDRSVTHELLLHGHRRAHRVEPRTVAHSPICHSAKRSSPASAPRLRPQG